MRPDRRHWLTGAAAIAAAIGGLGWSWWRRRDREALPDGFWALRFPRPDGGELALAPLRGRPWLLNFWATWCPPCVEELPLLDRFQRDHAARGWQVVGIAVDGPTPVREFLARRPLSFAIGLAGFGGTELSRQLGNERGALPFTVVFDRQGRPVRRRLGATNQEELARWAQEIG